MDDVENYHNQSEGVLRPRILLKESFTQKIDMIVILKSVISNSSNNKRQPFASDLEEIISYQHH